MARYQTQRNWTYILNESDQEYVRKNNKLLQFIWFFFKPFLQTTHDFKIVYLYKCKTEDLDHNLHQTSHIIQFIVVVQIECREDRADIAYVNRNSPTFALTVWMYSKWPPPCWKVMGLWLKNHWNTTSSDVSCVALQLSTTLSPTVTSTLCGLSSTRMASVSTKLLHCHPRQTQTYRDLHGNATNPKLSHGNPGGV